MDLKCLKGLKCKIKDVSLVEQVKSWHEFESFVPYQKIDAMSLSKKRANQVLEITTIHYGNSYSVDTDLIQTEDNSNLWKN